MEDRLPSPLCAECGSQMVWGVTTFHYKDDVIVISVPNEVFYNRLYVERGPQGRYRAFGQSDSGKR
ncbi:MAG: hypothetical protein ACUVV0_00560 [Anaerolineae bacterium]